MAEILECVDQDLQIYRILVEFPDGRRVKYSIQRGSGTPRFLREWKADE